MKVQGNFFFWKKLYFQTAQVILVTMSQEILESQWNKVSEIVPIKLQKFTHPTNIKHSFSVTPLIRFLLTELP
jgi:hypothetical protein